MVICAEKTKLMPNSANGIQGAIKVKGQKLGTVTSFKYLGAVVSDDGSKPEILLRIAQATAALTKLKPIWKDNKVSFGSKVKLMRFLVISIFLFACESGTLTAELEKKNTDLWNEMLPETIAHFIQGPCDQWGGSQKDPGSHWRIWWTPDFGQETETNTVCPRFKDFWFSKDNPTGHSERTK